MTSQQEWLETDGLGGFASGSVMLTRTRRYHALLMRSGPPSRRFILVNGFDAEVRTPAGKFALSAQRYQPGVTAPDGLARLESFTDEPWPMWIFRLPDGRAIRQEIFVARGRAVTVVTFTLVGDPTGCSLEVRPFFSGRDPHSLQHENPAFNFTPVQSGQNLRWTPYEGVPAIEVNSNASYRHDPQWYRNFLYETERARGLDDTEDLSAPGVFTWDFAEPEAVMIFASPTAGGDYHGFNSESAREAAAHYRALELTRRTAFTRRLHRAADDYLVRRGEGHTIIAGYPWFTDWGRDTFIALRGLCLATGRLEIARSILLGWTGLVSEGMLPNFFPDGGKEPEYNSVDASLWFIIAVHDYFAAVTATGKRVPAAERQQLVAAVEAILQGYAHGTRFGIRADTDGLLFAGQPGMQLTWMDAKVGDWVVTPRIGKPVEVQALWINALRIGATYHKKWRELARLAQKNFTKRFWNGERRCLYDVVDVDFVSGRNDASLRPNQIFAVGGLPFALLNKTQTAGVVAVVGQHLLTPLGLRSLAPEQPDYKPHYEGGVRERDGAYHQGTAWPWLACAFVEAWLRVQGRSATSLAEARERFLAPLLAHTKEAGLGHVTEIADAESPFTPRGCPFQAWSVGETLRLEKILSEET